MTARKSIISPCKLCYIMNSSIKAKKKKTIKKRVYLQNCSTYLFIRPHPLYLIDVKWLWIAMSYSLPKEQSPAHKPYQEKTLTSCIQTQIETVNFLLHSLRYRHNIIVKHSQCKTTTKLLQRKSHWLKYPSKQASK